MSRNELISKIKNSDSKEIDLSGKGLESKVKKREEKTLKLKLMEKKLKQAPILTPYEEAKELQSLEINTSEQYKEARKICKKIQSIKSQHGIQQMSPTRRVSMNFWQRILKMEV